MTEEEWLASEDAANMLRFVVSAASDRQLRLFACAVCRKIGFRLSEAGERAVEVAEAFADGQGDEWDLTVADEVFETQLQSGHSLQMGYQRLAGICLLADIANRHGLTFLADRSTHFTGSALLRDIFGNPFRSIPLVPEWRTDTAVILAQEMYESRDFSAMPILADALQDAGCDNPDVLSHCRDTSLTHGRGCWVVDLVLNKS
jgi:hypothetical protein